MTDHRLRKEHYTSYMSLPEEHLRTSSELEKDYKLKNLHIKEDRLKDLRVFLRWVAVAGVGRLLLWSPEWRHPLLQVIDYFFLFIPLLWGVVLIYYIYWESAEKALNVDRAWGVAAGLTVFYCLIFLFGDVLNQEREAVFATFQHYQNTVEDNVHVERAVFKLRGNSKLLGSDTLSLDVKKPSNIIRIDGFGEVVPDQGREYRINLRRGGREDWGVGKQAPKEKQNIEASLAGY